MLYKHTSLEKLLKIDNSSQNYQYHNVSTPTSVTSFQNVYHSCRCKIGSGKELNLLLFETLESQLKLKVYCSLKLEYSTRCTTVLQV